MKSKFLPDQQDPFSGGFDPTGAGFNSGFIPFAAGGGDNGGSNGAPPTATPALTGEAIVAAAAFTGTAETVVVSSLGVGVANANGFNIDLEFDAAAAAAPAFMSGIEQAAMILGHTITNKITVNINIDYSGTGGGASAGPDAGQYVSYSTVKADLIANAAPGDTTFNALPTGTTIQGQSQAAVWNAQLKLWGLVSANSTTTDDGSATFATDIASNALVGVALHELTHAMGRVPYGSQPDIFDFYRFTSPGTYLFTDNIPAQAAYFSLDGGKTSLAAYGLNSDPSDFLNSGAATNSDPFDEFYTPGSTDQYLTTLDKEQLDALGFNTMTTSQTIVVVATASEAVQGGAAVTLLGTLPTITDSASTTLSSATITIANAGGSAVAGDELYVNGIQHGSLGSGVTASWNASTDTLTLTGNASLSVYDTLLSEVTYQDTGTDSSTGSHPVRTVTWSVNDGTASFNTTSQIIVDRAPVETVANVVLSANTPVAASSLFTASDSDGDAIATYAFKDSGNGHFVLNGVAQANNQEIDVAAAQLAQLTYLGTGGVDSLQVRVNDGTTWSAWDSFTVTAPLGTVIESYGSTSLVEVSNDFFLASNSTGTGPELTYNGTPVAAGQLGIWTALGAEQTANGYEVAFKAASAGLYMIWTTDSNGNETSAVTGNGTWVESYETSFHQDLNGDGVTGLAGTVIESYGSTSLVEVSNDFFLASNSTGTGPELTYNGTPVAAGQMGIWTALGAEQTANGYEVAWKAASAGLYMIWTTDSNGNETSAVTGNGTWVESYETSFHQDLNGDGVTGLAGTVIESYGSTSLVEVSNDFFLASNSTGTGPELTYNGTPVAAGQMGIWTALGAEQTANGYEVAWKAASAGLYMIWTTDSNGNETSAVTGNGAWVESYETSFHQDLNGDGVTGLAGTVIESYGSTSLVEVSNDFFLASNSTGTGPELTYNGTPVAAGQMGIWTALGAEQTANGYEVAWKAASAGLYMIWTTDSNGNETSAVTGNGTWVESYETSFHQDLNGDGVTGLAGTVIESYGSTSLVEVSNDFFLASNSTGTGPELTYNGTPVAAGQMGIWTALGAEQTANGYEVAWKAASAGLYMIWTTDSNGNETSAVTGNGTWVESYEISFQQDLNGDGVIGVPSGVAAGTAPQADTGPTTIATGATLVAAADGGSVTFNGATGTLILDQSTAFSGQIFNFSGTGILASSDQIDLRDVNPSGSGITDSYANGVLTVSDGINTAHLDFIGTYAQDNFSFASDGHGGTIVYDLPAASPNTAVGGGPTGATTITATLANQTLTGTGANDSFVFNFAPGHATITNFQPASDVIQIAHSVFANVQALLAAAQNDGYGDVVITADAQDTITLLHVTVAQLQAHQSGFYIT